MNSYINAQNGFFSVNGKSVPITEEAIQKLLDFTISKLPVKDRQTLADNLEIEKTLLLESQPDWVETFKENYLVEKSNKLTWIVRTESGTITAENLTHIEQLILSMGLEQVSELSEWEHDIVTIAGHEIKVAIPKAIAIRKKQERKTK